MKSVLIRFVALAVGLYALTGFYIVGGNEKGVVRRFGRLILPLKPSGLHYDWPAPFTTVNRVNLAAMRTVIIGDATPSDASSRPLPTTPARTFLTGDQNLLHVSAQVHYRPSESAIGDYLFGQVAPEERLAQIAEAILVDLIAHCGVDFAHVSGLSELNDGLTDRLRSAVAEQRFGIEIEQAVIERVEPPVRVKAEFLDVSNARAEQARGIQEARTWAERHVAQAESERQRLIQGAEADRRARVTAASGSADRFRQLVAQMRGEATRLGRDYAAVRQLTVQRMSWQVLADIWPRVRKTSIVEADGPVDVSVFPNGPSPQRQDAGSAR